MLTQISISNYVLIDSLQLDFCRCLNIITGETGAGKSIILGALGLILGNRADTGVHLDPSKKCVIEGVFDIQNRDLVSFFNENDLDYADLTVIRREISPNGKTRAFINDTPANLRQINELTRPLIDLHEQWDTLEIREQGYQLYLLDLLAENDQLLHNYQLSYRQLLAETEALEELKKENSESKQEYDFIRFQLDELIKAEVKTGELSELERTLEQLENLEEIKNVLREGIFLLDNEEQGILTRLRVYAKGLRSIAQLDKSLGHLLSRIESSIEEAGDIQNQSEQLFYTFNQSDENLEEIVQRVDLLHALLNKHRAGDEEELIQIHDDYTAKVERFENLDTLVQTKSKQIDNLLSSLNQQALNIREFRNGVIPVIEDHVSRELQSMAMPHAKLKIELSDKKDFGPRGKDDVQYLFAANKGAQLKSLKEVASGGEISRLNLSIKSLIAGKAMLPTLVFDEIDNGLSGEVALRVGLILSSLAKNHQIISITHSPQVAAKADRHFKVYKTHHSDHSQTKIIHLESKEKIMEIATMLSGDPPHPAAIENAKDLINR